MQPFSVQDAARRWQDVPQLDPQTEREAALASIEFLKVVRDKAQALIDDVAAGKAPGDGSSLHEIWDFSIFNPNHIDFLLATLGEGEVRITLFGGEAKVGDTGVPGLWRLQTGRNGFANSFVLARLPRTVLYACDRGADKIPRIVNPGPDVFAAPAILEELQYRLGQFAEDSSAPKLPEDPVYSLELKRQPLSPGDMTALLSTVGSGDVDVELQGLTRSRIQRTAIKNLWRTRIINNADKTLLDAFAVACVPPEIPISVEEFHDTVAKCTELIDWIGRDLDRGTLGGGQTNGAADA